MYISFSVAWSYSIANWKYNKISSKQIQIALEKYFVTCYINKNSISSLDKISIAYNINKYIIFIFSLDLLKR